MTNLSKKQLENHLGTFHQVNIELARNLSLDTVMKRIVRLARDQAEARYAAMAIRDEEGEVEHFIQVGLSEEEVERMPHLPEGKGLLGVLGESRETIRLADLRTHPRSVGFPEEHPAMTSFLGVPILSGERILGEFYLTEKQNASEFTSNDARLMETLASYASVAITNARLYQSLLQRDQELNQKNQDLSLINELAHSIASSWDIKEIMSQTLSRVLDYLKVETGEIYLRDTGRKDLRLALLRGDHFEAFYTKNIYRFGEGMIGRVAEMQKPLVSYHLAEDPRNMRPAVPEAGFCCLIGIPLMSRGQTVGVMTLSSKHKHQFNTREIDLLSTVGNWTGTSIDNAQLQQQAKRVAILEERERIGMDLHDGVIQSLYSIGLTLDYVKAVTEEEEENTEEILERLQLATDGINSTINDIRSYVSDLRPRQMLENRSLEENIVILLDEFETHSKISGEFEKTTECIQELSYQKQITLFHICQEALSNTARHANATQAKVRLWGEDGRAYLEIQDNGKGFNIDATDTNLGHGLSNMQRRARKVGGDLCIDSQPLKGTSVLAWVPTS
jgi:signal transduction histidine kinase